jgi:hypothetical protein
MATYYLRAEAVNFDDVIYDTEDISTIRGGSFLLTDALMQDWNSLGIEEIARGASVGLFKFEAKGEKQAEEIRTRVLTAIEAKTGYLATFVVDWLEETEGRTFTEMNQMLIAKNRWRQLQQPTVILPDMKRARGPCEIDGVRPAVQKWTVGADVKSVSEAVCERKKKGVSLRQSLANKVLKDANIDVAHPLLFTNDLQELAQDVNAGALNGRIGLIHIDGNRFGRIRDQKCIDAQKYCEYHSYVQNVVRSGALAKILDYAVSPQGTTFRTDSGAVRLEVLLWGGDEIDIVVPAWQAWRTLSLFYQTTIGAKFDGIQLTHSAGLVLCHASAPILQIRRIAQELCKIAKEKVPEEIDKLDIKSNIFSYLTMESFDQVTRDVRTFLNKYHKPAMPVELKIVATEIKQFESDILTLRRNFPRNKVYKLVAAVRKGDNEILNLELAHAWELVSSSVRQETQESLKRLLSGNPNRWYVIADLWDYVKEAEHAQEL